MQKMLRTFTNKNSIILTPLSHIKIRMVDDYYNDDNDSKWSYNYLCVNTMNNHNFNFRRFSSYDAANEHYYYRVKNKNIPKLIIPVCSFIPKYFHEDVLLWKLAKSKLNITIS
jgi:hypothetical protein